MDALLSQALMDLMLHRVTLTQVDDAIFKWYLIFVLLFVQFNWMNEGVMPLFEQKLCYGMVDLNTWAS